MTAIALGFAALGCDSSAKSTNGADGGPTGAPGELVLGSQTTTTGTVDLWATIPATGQYDLVFDSGKWQSVTALYSDAAHTQLIGTCSIATTEDKRICRYSLDAGRVYLHVAPWYYADWKDTLVLLPIVDEGTAAAPVALGPVEQWYSVGASGSTYLTFDAPTDGGYTLLQPGASVALSFYANADFTAAPISTCVNQYPCFLDGVPAGPVGIRVDDATAGGIGDIFQLSVTKNASEGTPSSPLPLTLGTARSGSTEGWGRSFYSFTTTTAGNYTFDVANNTGPYPLTLTLYLPGSTSSVDMCQAAASSGSCVIPSLSAGTTFTLVTSTDATSTYSLTVSAGP